jgi:fibronectin type 3 domain-containing protein
MKLRFRIMKSWLCVLMALSSAQLMVGVAATWGATPEPPAASVPAPPGGIVVTPGNGKIVLTWNAASGATSYHVKRSTKSGGPYTEIAAPWWHGYTNVGLSNGTRYYYVISSVNSAGQSANSGQFSGIPSNAAQAPSTPGGLNAAPGDGKVGLTWAAPSSATSYKIKRASSSGGPFTQIATSTFAGYTNVGLQNGTTYYFAVSAVNSGGESANSAAVGAKPVAPSSAVTSVSVSPATASSITSGTLPFKATVQGTTTNKSVTWKVVLGHINASGLYTAPSKAGTDTVTAVSNADPTKSDSTVVTVTAASTPPPSDPPPPPPPSGTGLSDAFFGLSYTQIEASHYPSVPFGGVRLWDTNTTWAQIETSRGSYNWTDLDIWLGNISSHGQDAMYTFGRVPHWASSQPSQGCAYDVSDPGCAAPTSDLNSGDNIWKEFVTAVVKHSLSSPALHIPYYEMWNEPDLTRNWTGTPAQLATMVKDAYAIIHSLDPKAKVVGPTPSTANQYGVHFLPDYYAAGAANAQDIVGLHAYLYNGSSFATNPSGITTSISQLQKLMATYGISSKPIWFTEGSWSGSDSSSLSDSQKAAYLAQEYMLMWSTGAVSRYYWYAWDSNLGTLWTPSGGMTQAGITYNQLADWLIGSTPASNPCSEDSSGTWTCSLTLSTGYPGEIIWNANTSKTITVDASFLTSRTLANSTVHSISNHQVSIGPLPVLIVKGQAQ